MIPTRWSMWRVDNTKPLSSRYHFIFFFLPCLVLLRPETSDQTHLIRFKEDLRHDVMRSDLCPITWKWGVHHRPLTIWWIRIETMTYLETLYTNTANNSSFQFSLGLFSQRKRQPSQGYCADGRKCQDGRPINVSFGHKFHCVYEVCVFHPEYMISQD